MRSPGCGDTVYQSVIVADRIAALLQREGAEFVVGFPENRLLDSASRLGLRPIIARTERVAVNIVDGYARATNGERIAPCVTQYGPGAEAAFAAVAQAFGDRSPILLIPGEHAVEVQGTTRGVRVEDAYRPITRWAATLNHPAHGPAVFRQALNALRGVRNGPVLVAVANDVLNGDAGDADWSISSSPPRLTQAAGGDVEETARMLLSASAPVIVAGQGVLYANACAELLQLAELTNTPVATTLNGKSAFPEDHPLSLGAAARTRPAAVDDFFARADVILGIGTSFTRSLYITPMPAQATLGQIVNDPRDLATGYDVAFGCVGDAKLVLAQLLAEIGRSGPSQAAHGLGRARRRGRLARRVRGGVASAADVRREPDQPLPRDLGADGGRRPDAHRRHARRRASARSDRAVLAERRAARLSRVGQVHPARHGARPGDGCASRPARPALDQHHGRRGVRHGRDGLRDGGALPHPDPHDRAQQRADGRLHRVDARGCRALRAPTGSAAATPRWRGRSAGMPSVSTAPRICAAGSSGASRASARAGRHCSRS